jgi:MATE family multidrug resistance protein
MFTAAVRTEMKALVTIAAPIILSFLLLMSIGLISVLNVGHAFGESELAAVGFSVTFLNILGNSWLVGMVSALDTFGTQAFGAKNFVMFSNVMQRSLFLCMATCVPLFVLFMFNEAILDAFHYDVTVRNLAAPYPPTPPPSPFTIQLICIQNAILLGTYACSQYPSHPTACTKFSVNSFRPKASTTKSSCPLSAASSYTLQ